jgi:2-oxo-4-hydroxy-4-carboxy--5-ureidoimidazoline (OHCU) decarboxylase
VHDLPRKLSAEELAELFGGRTRLTALLAERENPLYEARNVLRELPEKDQIEALNVHPPIGARGLTGTSAVEQGEDEDPDVLARLAELNRVYEEKFGFRFLVFVNRRTRREVVPVLEERLARDRDEELATALDELVAIAEDRWKMNVPPPTP